MNLKKPIIKQSGKKKIIIKNYDPILQLLAIRENFRSGSMAIDEELLLLMQEAITEYFVQKGGYKTQGDYCFALNTQTLTEPPCKTCKHFYHTTTPIDQDGEHKLCHSHNMVDDFKCFEPK